MFYTVVLAILFGYMTFLTTMCLVLIIEELDLGSSKTPESRHNLMTNIKAIGFRTKCRLSFYVLMICSTNSL